MARLPCYRNRHPSWIRHRMGSGCRRHQGRSPSGPKWRAPAHPTAVRSPSAPLQIDSQGAIADLGPRFAQTAQHSDESARPPGCGRPSLDPGRIVWVLLAVRPGRERFALVKPVGWDATDTAVLADSGVGGDDTPDDRAHRVHVTAGFTHAGSAAGLVGQEGGPGPPAEGTPVLPGAWGPVPHPVPSPATDPPSPGNPPP